MDRRTEESCNLKGNLGFSLRDGINTKEQTVLKLIKNTFEGEDMQTQCSVAGYRIELFSYFHNYRFAIEFDKIGLNNINIDHERKGRKEVEKELCCDFIRINPDKQNLKKYKKSTKKSFIDKISKRHVQKR